jgi:hypothetical protein
LAEYVGLEDVSVNFRLLKRPSTRVATPALVLWMVKVRGAARVLSGAEATALRVSVDRHTPLGDANPAWTSVRPSALGTETSPAKEASLATEMLTRVDESGAASSHVV